MFRILSIDGGGIKGVFPAAFLAALEEDLPAPISAYFDLIAGTSTGGIIALGLGLGLTAKQLLDFYVSHGPAIFPSSPVSGWLRHWIAPRYSQEPLRIALEKAIGGKLLGDSSRRLLVPSLNAATGEIYIYKTRHHEKLKTDWRVPAVDVALATSAAPSYFPVHGAINNISFIDGGIWANNPTGLAAVEAVTLLAQRPEDVRILSLGCTYCPVDLRPRFAGKLGWAKKALEAAMSGQAGGSMGTAYMIPANYGTGVNFGATARKKTGCPVQTQLERVFLSVGVKVWLVSTKIPTQRQKKSLNGAPGLSSHQLRTWSLS